MSGGMVALKKSPCRFFGQRLEDRVELPREAHREHLVGLVEDEHADAGGIERPLAQVIEHAPGRADDDLRAGLERLDLLAHRRAAVDGDDLDVPRNCPICSTSRDTCSASSRVGAEDERLHRLGRRAHEAVDDGQAEGGGLAGAGAGLHDQAPPRGRRLEDGAAAPAWGACSPSRRWRGARRRRAAARRTWAAVGWGSGRAGGGGHRAPLLSASRRAGAPRHPAAAGPESRVAQLSGGRSQPQERGPGVQPGRRLRARALHRRRVLPLGNRPFQAPNALGARALGRARRPGRQRADVRAEHGRDDVPRAGADEHDGDHDHHPERSPLAAQSRAGQGRVHGRVVGHVARRCRRRVPWLSTARGLGPWGLPRRRR